jgi:hypothetical protein
VIAEIEGRYAEKALPLAEEIKVDSEGKVYSSPLPVPKGDVYSDTLDAVEDALSDALLGENNALKPDDLEAMILSRTLERYRDKPYRVHQDFLIVRDNLRQKLKDGVFPLDHPPIINLERAVEDGAVNIRRAIPQVRDTVAANAQERLASASPEERKELLALLQEIILMARADFAEELEEDRAEIEAPLSEPTERAALYRTGSRFAKIRVLVVDGTLRVTDGLTKGYSIGEAVGVILRLLGL